MNKIAEILFRHHSHVERFLDELDRIVYSEEAVIAILKELGHEGPIWDEQRAAREVYFNGVLCKYLKMLPGGQAEIAHPTDGIIKVYLKDLS